MSVPGRTVKMFKRAGRANLFLWRWVCRTPWVKLVTSSYSTLAVMISALPSISVRSALRTIIVLVLTALGSLALVLAQSRLRISPTHIFKRGGIHARVLCLS
jgi:hypothetical protein